MRLIIHRHALAGLLDLAQAVAARKEPISVLRNVRLEALDGGLCRATAGSLAWAAVGVAEAEVAEPGEVGLPIATLHQMMEVAPAAPVTIATGEAGRVDVAVAGGPEWHLQAAADMNLFLTVAQPAEADILGTWKVPRAPLAGALQRVAYAAADPAKAPQYAAVHMGGGAVVAGDFYRCQAAAADLGGLELRLPSAIIDGLVRVLRLTEDESVEVESTEREVFMSWSGALVKVPKLQVPTSDLGAMFLDPASQLTVEAEVGRDELHMAVRQAQVTSGEAGMVALALGSERLEVAAEDGPMSGKAVVAARHTPLERPLSARLSARMLLEALSGADGATVRLRLAHGGSMAALSDDGDTAVLLQG